MSDGLVLGYYTCGINSTSFASKDGSTIVTANRENLLFLDTESLVPTQSIKLEQAVVGPQIAFSDDNRLMVAQLSPTWLAIINVADHQILARLNVSIEDAFSQILFTPDSSHLVAVSSAQSFVQVWDLSALRERLCKMGLDWEPSDLRPQATAGFNTKVLAKSGTTTPRIFHEEA